MLKFEYHYLTNSLFTQIPGESSQSIPQGFANEYGGKGFILEPVNHWITFTIYESKIRAFYKQSRDDNLVIYYQQDCPRQETIELTFTYLDIVEKVEGKWNYRNK